MTSRQTKDAPVNPQETYGIGCSVKIGEVEGPFAGRFKHRGAWRTPMWVDPASQLVMIILIERFDMTGEE